LEIFHHILFQQCSKYRDFGQGSVLSLIVKKRFSSDSLT
jgi:hypothetical protein